jgi:predicted Fe-Mo cluster-binding NifX family protein
MVPEFIQSHGADVMLSGGMGRRAISFFEQYGIQVGTGANGTVRTTLENYFGGQLSLRDNRRDSVAMPVPGNLFGEDAEEIVGK